MVGRPRLRTVTMVGLLQSPHRRGPVRPVGRQAAGRAAGAIGRDFLAPDKRCIEPERSAVTQRADNITIVHNSQALRSEWPVSFSRILALHSGPYLAGSIRRSPIP